MADRLPLAAASSLMAKGYGYRAEGDVLTACLVSVGHTLIGDAHFTEAARTHEVMNLGHHAAAWRVFCQLTGIEYVQV